MAPRPLPCNTVGDMCGRYVSATTPDQVAAYFGADVLGESLVESSEDPNWNVAPTQQVKVVREDADAHRRVEAYRWGLIPFWAKDERVGARMINARSETVAEKNAFRRALVKRRCIIPVDGFYEWQKLPDTSEAGGPKTKKSGKPPKQPWYIRPADDSLFAFAGLYEVWRGPGGDAPPLYSCTILTGSPNDKMATIHDRMPVMLPSASWDRWLDPDLTDADEITTMFTVAPSELLHLVPVSTAVNRVANNVPELIDPVDPDAHQQADNWQGTLL